MKKYKLKNIVLSGGGHVGFTQIGLLYYLIEKKKLDIKNVENIYCTSIGSMVAIMFILNYDKDELFNYLINKPWEKFLKININNFLDYNTNKGLIGGYVFEEVLTSLLLAKDIKKDVTLKEFYNLNKINLNIFTIEINEFVTVRLSHKTHPNLKLLDAVHMTAAVPFVIHPHYYNNGVYIDGGLHINYPLNPCIFEDKCKKEETLGIRAWKKQKDVFNLNKDSNVLVIGCGGAGLRAAIEVKLAGLQVSVLGKRAKTDSHTVLAAGGINASYGNVDKEDSWSQHFADTLIEGYGIADPNAVEILAKESPKYVSRLINGAQILQN